MRAVLTGLALASLLACGPELRRESAASSTSDGPSCNVDELHWKAFLANVAMDAATELGRWELTTDLEIARDRLQISPVGFARCEARGYAGCPLLTEALEAQDGEDVVVDGELSMSPPRIRAELLAGFRAQQAQERDETLMVDRSAPAPHAEFRAPTREGLPHELTLIAAAEDACSTRYNYRVEVAGGADWDRVRAKLVTVGYLRGNDALAVQIDPSAGTLSIDPFNVDFVPPSQVGGGSPSCAVVLKQSGVQTWRSTEDPAPSVCPVGAACVKKSYDGTRWYSGIVRSSGSYRYCYVN